MYEFNVNNVDFYIKSAVGGSILFFNINNKRSCYQVEAHTARHMTGQ